MPSLTVENYLKAILQLAAEREGKQVATGQIATALKVAPGTVTSMLKALSESGLATYRPYEGVKLTAAGKALALRVQRRHRLIELFLVKTLDLPWDQVHEEAENMEHAVSDALVDRIDAMLGRPSVDPHGDPIPRADGSLVASEHHELSDCPEGFRFELARVLDQTPDFLRFLTDSKLTLRAAGEVLTNRREAGVVTVLVDRRETTLGHAIARNLLVTAAAGGLP